MFTGIIEEIGKVKKIAGNKNVLVLETRFPDLRTGESIAVNGVCLTVSRTEKDLASFNLSLETMEKTGFQNQNTLFSGNLFYLSNFFNNSGKHNGFMIAQARGE